jgi:hypothetical protein
MQTFTFTGTSTYSIADVKAVMQNTFEDIVGFANREMITFEMAKKWIDDLTYTLNQKALSSFEIQLYNGIHRFKSYRYQVDTNGLISTGSQSGGIAYYEIPSGTTVRLYADLNQSSPNYQLVTDELLRNRGWGNQGSGMNGTATHERNYVSNSLQIKRSVIS